MRISRMRTKIYSYIWIIFTTILIIYNEILIYYTNTFKWSTLQCTNRHMCTKILLVADPQIIGDHQEIIHFLTPLSIFDSDRYLKKTYLYAFDFVQPDIVIFLGDLMDEGYTATDTEFYHYVRRVFNIFLNTAPQKVRHIWLPGDNDVGGEDVEVTPAKLKRFERSFSQPDIISYKNTTFFKINRLIMSIPVYKGHREFYDTNNVFIGLSHIPLLFVPSPFVDKVFTKMLPHLLFTAHEHKSMVISTDALLRQVRQIVPVTSDNNGIFEYALGVTDIYEIMIPTCSYRMGTRSIGYGYAILENNELRYTVLWSPSRFDQLITYAILLVCFTLGSLYNKCKSAIIN